mgnify:CR=1 FL=1
MKNNDILEELNNNVLDVEEFAYYGEFELASKLLIAWKKKAEDTNRAKTMRKRSSTHRHLCKPNAS